VWYIRKSGGESTILARREIVFLEGQRETFQPLGVQGGTKGEQKQGAVSFKQATVGIKGNKMEFSEGSRSNKVRGRNREITLQISAIHGSGGETNN